MLNGHYTAETVIPVSDPFTIPRHDAKHSNISKSMCPNLHIIYTYEIDA
jgi:hypothetical protein